MDGLVIDIHPKVFPLTGGVDGVTLSKDSILVHDQDDRASICGDNTSNSSNGDVIDLMIVNALNGNSAEDVVNDTHIIASNSSIGTTVHEGVGGGPVAFAHSVGEWHSHRHV